MKKKKKKKSVKKALPKIVYSDINVEPPMLAKELPDMDLLSSKEFFCEEKIDGTRGLVYFTKENDEKIVRVFSRRVSKKSNKLNELTDLIPHIRDFPYGDDLNDTIMDCEMYIPDVPFKESSGVLHSLPDRAVDTQNRVGKVVLCVFDIMKLRGEDLINFSFVKRRKILEDLFEEMEFPYIRLIDSFRCDEYVYVEFGEKILKLNAKEYYSFICRNGGEGVMLKHANGVYCYGKRTSFYFKLKKKITRDCIVIGYSPPEKLYTGKFPDGKWKYWEFEGEKINKEYGIEMMSEGFIPVTRYWYEGWIGTMKLGVFKYGKIIEVGECSGFDEWTREKLSRDRKVNYCVEVLCNEIFDTGKMRHPRFIRFRDDKEIFDCTWDNHIGL